MARSLIPFSAIALTFVGLVFACTTTVTTTNIPTGDAGASSSSSGSSGSSGGKDGSGGGNGDGTGDGGGTKKDSGGTADPPCATECATTACANKQPSASCQTCLLATIEPEAPCYTDVLAACNADPDCVKSQTCLTECPGAGDCVGVAANTCNQCCVDKHQTGAQTFSAAIVKCACGL